MDLLTTFLASILIWVMLLGLVVLWIVDGKLRKETALHAFVASATAWVVGLVLFGPKLLELLSPQ